MASFGYAGSIGPGEWVTVQKVIGCRYAIVEPSHFTLGATTSGITLSAGQAGGGGVFDEWLTSQAVALSRPASGTSWWLIVLRRDWTVGVSSFVAIPAGTSTPSVLPTRQSQMGVVDDQPLWLVSWPASSSTPNLASAIDLRLIGRGPSNYVATHDMVRSYFQEAGATLRIGRVDWVCTISPGGVLQWESAGVLGANGSGTNGSWHQTPDGLLICWHTITFPAKPNFDQDQRWYYPSPVPFVSIPRVTTTLQTTAPNNMNAGISAPGVYSTLITFNRSTNHATGVQVDAIGRWK